jgi:hypothetical protein
MKLNPEWKTSIKQRCALVRYRSFIPNATGSALNQMLIDCYGVFRQAGESDDDYRDRATLPSVPERQELHDFQEYDS